jgi:predicted amino acid-binding ACT domain protein
MAIAVKNAKLWVLKGPDRAGFTAEALEPLAAAGVNLTGLMSYCYPGESDRAAVEVFPVKGRKAESAARAAGLEPAHTPCLLVEGDDRPGLGAALSRAVAEAGISMSFLVAQAIGRKFSALIGFDSEADASAATKAMKAAARKRGRNRGR